MGWDIPLWDVCAKPGGVSLCCRVAFCDCIVYGDEVNKLPPESGVPFAGDGCLAGCVYFCTNDLVGLILGPGCLGVVCSFWGASALRRHVATETMGSTFKEECVDVCAASFCSKCALCQEINTLRRHETWNTMMVPPRVVRFVPLMRL